ncbi:hypothetical protein F4778DRAFT_747350 [Xylariomycetidae sp. FL2044]|nr:hypothetical protein F4778DRAFT_747350 [Xylariomycetidae sp. FL2044]
MEQRIAQLEQQLQEEVRRREGEERRREEAQRQREEAQRQREEAERGREEEQRRREEAEQLAKRSQPQVLPSYLDACHSLSLSIRIVTHRSLTTKGDATNPVGRIFPHRIVPWPDFATRQVKIWNQINDHPLTSNAIFPSLHQLDYVASMSQPISSETGLRHFERDTVENAVKKLLDEIHNNPSWRQHFGIQGSVTFESHTNLGNDVDTRSDSFRDISIGEDNAEVATPVTPKTQRRKNGKGGVADQFCIYKTSDGQNIPALAIEYKAPHKVTRDEIVVGLESEIQPKRDVIDQEGEDFAFTSKCLAAAVVTQLFSYMVNKGIPYGYVCTGEAFVFLHIPDDPSIVYYSVCVPNLDVQEGDANRLQYTAVAQVFAFVLQALSAPPLPQSWRDRAANLETWAVSVHDVLSSIPSTEQKAAPTHSYKPSRWKGFARSAIRTRSRCQEVGTIPRHQDGQDDDDEGAGGGGGTPPSPSPGPVSSRSSGQNKAQPTTKSISQSTRRKTGGQGKKGHQHDANEQSIQQRPFCTHRCLLGLANGDKIDTNCPNASDHGRQHLDKTRFLKLVRTQLFKDRGPDADAMPLYLSGAVGSLFKVRLSSHGYTLVAKGVEEHDLNRLQHENEMYSHLFPIQGIHTPVCLGITNLVLPYYYDSGEFRYFMFLSWAGQPLFNATSHPDRDRIPDAVGVAFEAMHRLRILHGDAEPRNVLYDTRSGRVMIVDFERAAYHPRQPLGSIDTNRKRKHDTSLKTGKDDFAVEMQSIREGVRRCIG